MEQSMLRTVLTEGRHMARFEALGPCTVTRIEFAAPVVIEEVTIGCTIMALNAMHVDMGPDAFIVTVCDGIPDRPRMHFKPPRAYNVAPLEWFRVYTDREAEVMVYYTKPLGAGATAAAMLKKIDSDT